MTKAPAHRSLTEHVYAQLRTEILSGRRAPGSRLGFAPLQQAYGASVGVIREALVRLTGQGLVQSVPHIGFTVTPLSHGDLVDLTDARVVIECAAFAQAIAHGDARWEAQVVASHHLLSRTPLRLGEQPAGVSEQWAGAHLDFHRALLAGCPNRRLRELADSLRLAAELYRCWSQSFGSEPDRDVAAEHDALRASALDRDPVGGPARLADHLRRTRDNLLALPELAAEPAGGAG